MTFHVEYQTHATVPPALKWGATLARGDVPVPFRRDPEYKAWTIQGLLGPTTFGCTLHFRDSPLGEDYSANAPVRPRGLLCSPNSYCGSLTQYPYG